MCQEGVMKIIQNLKNMREDKKAGFFSYWTQCIWTAAIVYLKKYYKFINKRRQMILDAMNQIECETNTPFPDYLEEGLRSDIEEYD